MPVIGIAEVLIKPSFKGAQQSVGRELDGIASTEGSRAGKKMGGALGGAMKVGALAVAGGAIAGLGVALTKGFGRLQSIENAKAKLTGLGHDVSSVTAIMNDAMASVKGTAFGLDEAASVSASAVAAGIKPGKELERTLRLTGDAATIAGVGMGEMGAIFNKVAASNKIQGDVIAQLQDAGIPITQLLGKELNKTAGEVLDMAAAGEIGFDTFQKAMEKGLGGAALESGKTLEGAFKNTMAAVSRIGASLLSGVYPKIQAFFSNALEWLKPLEAGAKEAGASIGTFLESALSGVQDLWAGLTMNSEVRAEFTGQLEGLVKVGADVRSAFDAVLPPLRDFGKWIVDNRDWLSALVVTVGAMFVGMKLWTGSIALWQAATATATAVQLAFNLAMSANPIGLVVMGIAALVAGLIYFFTQTELGKAVVANVWSFIQTVVGGVVTWFQTVVLPAILTVFNAVGAVFTWLYETVIKPVFDSIGVIIGGFLLFFRGVGQIVASIIQNVLGPVFTWLYENKVKPVFDAIGAVIEWVWLNVIKPRFDAIGSALGTIGGAFSVLYDTFIKPKFDAIGAVIEWVWLNKIKPVFSALSDFVNKTIPAAFEFGVALIKKHWDTLQDIAKAPVRFVVDTVINDGLIGAFNNIAGILPGIDKLPRVALPKGFMNGGYTGNGGRDEPAGIVHGGEFVFTKEQTKRAGVKNLYAMADALAGYANGGFVNPLKQLRETQGYNRIHKGVDFGVPVGTPVFATENGRVSHSGPGARAPGVWGGNEVHIDGGSGIQSWFAHLSSMAVKVGDMVRAGQQIALSGNTGISSGPHLHFGTFAGGWPNDVNPYGYLSGAGVPSGGGFNPLAGLIDGLLSKFKGAFPGAGFMADIAMGIGKKLFTSVTDLITGGGKGSATGPNLYDLGGILPPGISQVVNRTGKPEAILNPQQWADIHRLATAGPSSPASLDGATLMLQAGSELMLAKVVHKGVHEATRGRKGIL